MIKVYNNQMSLADIKISIDKVIDKEKYNMYKQLYNKGYFVMDSLDNNFDFLVFDSTDNKV